MAFVKEFISEADREKYNLDMYRLNRDSKSWVIDRERDCFLRWLGCDSNRPDMGIECPYEHWLFYYRGTAMMLDMFINGSKKHRPCITYQIDYIYIYRNSSKSVFIVFVAGLPRKPKLPFADWYSTYARSFSKAACSFPTRKSCALLPIASVILQNGAIRFVWQSLPPHQSTPVPTKQMPYPCNHRQQGFFVSHQDYPARVLMPKDNLFYP